MKAATDNNDRLVIFLDDKDIKNLKANHELVLTSQTTGFQLCVVKESKK